MKDAPIGPDDIGTDAAWLVGFESMSRRLRPALLRFFRRRSESEAVAEEQVQELFLRLLRRADLFALNNIDGYVFEAAMNLARDRARRDQVRARDHHVDFSNLPLASEEPSAERVVQGRQRLVQLMQALQSLPPRTRMVLVLSRFENMTYAQIGKRLGISVSAVEKHVVKALAGLQERAVQ